MDPYLIASIDAPAKKPESPKSKERSLLYKLFMQWWYKPRRRLKDLLYSSTQDLSQKEVAAILSKLNSSLSLEYNKNDPYKSDVGIKTDIAGDPNLIPAYTKSGRIKLVFSKESLLEITSNLQGKSEVELYALVDAIICAFYRIVCKENFIPDGFIYRKALALIKESLGEKNSNFQKSKVWLDFEDYLRKIN